MREVGRRIRKKDMGYKHGAKNRKAGVSGKCLKNMRASGEIMSIMEKVPYGFKAISSMKGTGRKDLSTGKESSMKATDLSLVYGNITNSKAQFIFCNTENNDMFISSAFKIKIINKR